MAFQVSPGVQVKEIDATSVIPAVSTSIGGFAGAFNWGPAEEIKLVSSEDEMAAIFSTPDDNTAKYFLTAASFLKYGNALKVVRVVPADAENACVGSTPALVKNDEEYESASLSNANQGEWIAKFPGALGNSLKVEVCTAGGGFSGWAYAGQFDAAPDTSDFATNNGATNADDEIHIVVVDEDGHFTGEPGSVLETFAFASQASDAKDSSGTSLYYKNVVNSRSQYIAWASHDDELTDAGNNVSGPGADSAFTTVASVKSYSLIGGSDGGTITPAVVALGYDLFEDAETVDVNLLFACPDDNGSTTIAVDLLDIADARKDCVAFISPPVADSTGGSPLTDVLAFNTALGRSSSYGFLDSSAVYVYDKYNDVYRYIGASGITAGLCANTDQVADAWFSPAGVNRGQLRGVTKLAFNPNKAQRDSLYKAGVNPLVSFPGEGTMLFGDKTMLKRPSAFDRINVRRLFITLEKAISTAAKAQLFEFNDEFTRAQFRNMIEPFMRDVKGRRGVTDFLVVCDDTNNTGQVIDTNSFVADIYIKPARSINFITLNFIATRTGVDFSEVAGG